jgi:hypothetical protein
VESRAADSILITWVVAVILMEGLCGAFDCRWTREASVKCNQNQECQSLTCCIQSKQCWIYVPLFRARCIKRLKIFYLWKSCVAFFERFVVYLSAPTVGRADEVSGSHGSWSLLFVIRLMMVWHFVRNSHKVMTALVVIVVVEISLQFHRYKLSLRTEVYCFC